LCRAPRHPDLRGSYVLGEAMALARTILPSLLLRADEGIE